MKTYNIGVVGNPNSGKTTLFNALTGGKHRVGNWPGVTVDRIEGAFTFDGHKLQITDLPGIYSLSTTSEDEEIAREFIINENPDLIVNIVDASHLERNLYLTLQLLEMKVPMLVVLNMMDRVKQKNLKINVDELSDILDCPVVCTVAKKANGLDLIKGAILQSSRKGKISSAPIYYSDDIEDSITRLQTVLKKEQLPVLRSERWTALKLLEADYSLDLINEDNRLLECVDRERKRLHGIAGEDSDILIAEGRYGFINAIIKKVVDKSNFLKRSVTDAVDKIVLNRYLGVPVFLLAMYLVFWITINFGGCFIDFFDIFSGAFFVDGLRMVLDALSVPEFLITLLADGIGGGVQTVSTFIPPIFFMFLCLAFLEDSGYMARGAFIMDRFMRAVGLPGKAFVPMLVGFGCNVPAIMSTRTLENPRDRTLTILLNPFMSCGARLPVYAFFAAAFFPRSGGLIVFSLYIIGIIAAIGSAFIFKSTLLKGDASSFIMELPPYHIPTFKGIVVHTWDRLQGFIWRAGKAILIVVVLLSFVNSIGTDGSFGNQGTKDSVLSSLGKAAVPIFRPMGIKDENWPAVVGLFTGVFAKESVVATLDSLYATDEISEESEFSFATSMKEALISIPEAFSEVAHPFSERSMLTDTGDAVADMGVSEVSFIKVGKKFDGKIGAYAYLLFILLYMPCVAAIAAVYRELNFKWAIFSSLYLSGVAWSVSTFFYQTATFFNHPWQSIFWIVFCFGLGGSFYLALKRFSWQ